MDVGGVQQGDQVLLDELVSDPPVEVVEAAADDVAVVLDLEADGLHRWLVQVLFQGRQKLQHNRVYRSLGELYGQIA